MLTFCLHLSFNFHLLNHFRYLVHAENFPHLPFNARSFKDHPVIVHRAFRRQYSLELDGIISTGWLRYAKMPSAHSLSLTCNWHLVALVADSDIFDITSAIKIN